MKKYGILMTPENAVACHLGKKTVTRRRIKTQPVGVDHVTRHDDGWLFLDASHRVICRMTPRYNVGCIVAIRETHWRWGRYERNEKGNWRFVATDSYPIEFKNPDLLGSRTLRECHGYHKRPGLFLPHDLARTYWKIVDVRPERLQDITVADAKAEGVTFDAISNILADYDTADVRPHHWMHNHPDGAAESYCDECIDKAVDAERKKYPDDDIQSDGGYDTPESEGVQCCEICGKLVEYNLLESGIREEVDHFEEHGFDLNKPRHAHELERIFVEADYIEDADLKDRVYRLGFFVLWDSINAKKSPWKSNPWVWRYEGRRVEKPCGSEQTK